MRWLVGILAILLLAVPRASAQADDEDDPDQTPTGSFRIETEAGPTNVAVEDPIVFVVRISATGPVRKPPRRLPLSELPGFARDFHIEDVLDPALDIAPVVRLVGLANPWAFPGGFAPQSVWEFRYGLKPKRLNVREIPEVSFVFSNPRILSADRRMMTLFADAIPIAVKPREAVQTAVHGPESAFVLVTGPGLLARVQPWHPPGTATWALLLAVPPCLCVAWYLAWRRLYPNAVRRAVQRRSRAARVALDLLRRLPAAPEPRARLAATALTRYLHLRLDLPFEEPTPRETAAFLVGRGCSLDLATAILEFYQACAAARFQATPPAEATLLPQSATDLILAMEAKTIEDRGSRIEDRHPEHGPLDSRFSILDPRFSIFLLLAMTLSSAAADLSDEALVEQASTAFGAGVGLRDNAEQARPRFRQAAALLEELRQRGINNPLLQRNLGNAYLLADDLPRAILTYRQGLRLAPGDRDLKRSLNEARELVVYRDDSRLGRPGQDHRPPWLPNVRPPWLFAGVVLLYLAGWGFLTRWFMVRQWLHLVLGVAAFLGTVGLVLVFVNVTDQEKVEVEMPLVVIAEDGVLLRKGNHLNFPARWDTPVNRGVEARLLFDRGDFVQIQLAGGEIGWVPRELILIDAP